MNSVPLRALLSFLGAAALFSETSLLAAPVPAAQRMVILISIDGFPAWLWRDPTLPIPHLRALAAAQCFKMPSRHSKVRFKPSKSA